MGVRFALTAALLLTACEDTMVEPNLAGTGSAARGESAAQRLGCGACHDIPGVWPQGRTGPSLHGFAGRGLIAGKFPNRPDAVAAFLLDPSGTAMPKVPMSPRDATDLAAFLHQSDAR
jgi:cytochrome c1